jgi:thiamine transport system permease protein
VLALTQLVALGAVVGWSTYSQRRHALALAMRPPASARRPRRRGERVVVRVTAIATAAVVTAPLVALVERSLRADDGYSLRAWRSLGDSEVRRGVSVSVDPLGALLRSAQTAAWATALAVVIGAVAALAIAAAGRLGRGLDTGLMLPIGTSAVTIGFGMLITFDTPPVDWRAEWWIVPVGHALVAVPFVVRVTLGVLRSLDPRLADAAATLGASPVRAWREITVPHLWRPLVAGGGLAAAISLGEFGATSFLSRSGQETMPIAIERLLGRTGTVLQAQGYALAVILAAATIAIVLAVDATGDLGSRVGHRDVLPWRRDARARGR